MPMDGEKEKKGDAPTPSEMVSYAREYIRSYMDAVAEKSPDQLPAMAQQSPYNIDMVLLPNNCYGMILVASNEMKIKASAKNWDEIQDLVMKGVDFFLGFYPHEMKSIGDWKKHGRRDAIRDVRLISDSDLARAAGNLSQAIDEMSRIASSNPALAERASEHIQILRDIEDKLRRSSFAPTDAIATLQDLKGYKPTYERMIIEYPDRAIMEKILDGIEDIMTIRDRMDTLESRMFEVERTAAKRTPAEDDVPEIKDRMTKIEGHLEKVSNILHLLNAKVEKYFTKTAETERQAEIEKAVQELTKKINALMEVLARMQNKQDNYGQDFAKEISRLEEEISTASKRVKRLERYFVDLAKSVEE